MSGHYTDVGTKLDWAIIIGSGEILSFRCQVGHDWRHDLLQFVPLSYFCIQLLNTAQGSSMASSKLFFVGLTFLNIPLICGIAQATDWNQFRGPGRDNISLETGLLAEWPAGGPELLWRASGLGE